MSSRMENCWTDERNLLLLTHQITCEIVFWSSCHVVNVGCICANRKLDLATVTNSNRAQPIVNWDISIIMEG